MLALIAGAAVLDEEDKQVELGEMSTNPMRSRPLQMRCSGPASGVARQQVGGGSRRRDPGGDNSDSNSNSDNDGGVGGDGDPGSCGCLRPCFEGKPPHQRYRRGGRRTQTQHRKIGVYYNASTGARRMRPTQRGTRDMLVSYLTLLVLRVMFHVVDLVLSSVPRT